MTYLENSSLEFSSDIQNNSFNKTLLLCLKNKVFYKMVMCTVSDKTDLSITPLKLGIKELH
jgi:hypothetical protein